MATKSDPFEPPGITRERAEVLLENVARDRYGAVTVPDGPEWFDADGADGNPLEFKACALRVRDSGSRRRGRWLIRRENHETLLFERGRYVLGVYDRRPEIVAIANVSSRHVEALLEGASWFECASSEHGGDATQITYSEVFPDLDPRLTAPPSSAGSIYPDAPAEPTNGGDRVD